MATEVLNRLHDLGFRDHGEESVAELMRCAPDAAGAKWASALIRRMRLELAKLEQFQPRTGGGAGAAAAGSAASNVEFLRARGVLMRSGGEETAFDVLETVVAILQSERLRVANAAALEALAAHTRPVAPPTGEDGRGAKGRRA